MSCAIGRRCSLDPMLLWLWCRLEAIAQIRPLAWELPQATGAVLKKKKKKKKRGWALKSSRSGFKSRLEEKKKNQASKRLKQIKTKKIFFQFKKKKEGKYKYIGRSNCTSFRNRLIQMLEWGHQGSISLPLEASAVLTSFIPLNWCTLWWQDSAVALRCNFFTFFQLQRTGGEYILVHWLWLDYMHL